VKPRREHARSARERDLRELRAYRKQTEQRVADALITVLCRADRHTLAALGVVVAFVAQRATRRSR
jgi:hypothetical protein